MPPQSNHERDLSTVDDSMSSPPKTSQQKSQRRSVKFDDNVVVQNIPGLESFSSDHWVEIWYSPSELDQTHAECQETVRRMQNGEPVPDDDDEFTRRGLEYMTPSGFDIAKLTMDGVRLVLEEQARQRKEGISDSILIAEALAPLSKHRLRIANLAGMKDARGIPGASIWQGIRPPREARSPVPRASWPSGPSAQRPREATCRSFTCGINTEPLLVEAPATIETTRDRPRPRRARSSRSGRPRPTVTAGVIFS